MLNAPAAPFKCPNCGALYEVVRVEAAPANDREITCRACGGRLPGREGALILKYFLIARRLRPSAMTPAWIERLSR